ncbi:universal stress protein [Flagellimonas meridianipacifica]|uniref:Nucleotide-binding universal stress UspA family protein n=1 Tax=Flagellimonas meridianipacifica TaxID=1080225 RepID=A0A2T0MD40_9FLAO|nr:universal stress protein [Allomuricauda pacifica]PRX55418.1 nucleotide-binding universal stress UspA family protein [Allomuricauda pacifica]
MKLLKKILVAHDFGKSSQNVISSAIELAKIFQSTIVPIHVLPDDIENQKAMALLNETALTKLNETAKMIACEGLETGEPILVEGVPHEAIVRAAVKVSANLILVGCGETQKADTFRLGTTAERIIQKSEKPVFVIKEEILLNVHHILCPVDFSEASKRALQNAITMARKFKSELTILNVCEQAKASWLTSDNLLQTVNEEKCKEEKEKFETFLEEFNLADVNWTKEAPIGNPAEEILSTVSKKMIDLLIMGTSGRTGLNRMFMGSVTEKVVREVPCSFLTLKSEDVISLDLKTHIRDIEELYETAMELVDNGFFYEAIGHLKACLNINDMYVPAYKGIAKAYDKLDQPEKARFYRMHASDIMEKIWYQKIEDEVRKLRGSSER